jgi:hypothetical protein
MSKPEEGMDAAVATKALDALEEAAKEVDDRAWPALREAARAYAAAWDDYRDPSRQARARDRLEDAARDFVAAEDHEHAIGFCDACCRPMTGSEVDAAIALGRDPLAIRVDSGPGRAAKTAPRPKAGSMANDAGLQAKYAAALARLHEISCILELQPVKHLTFYDVERRIHPLKDEYEIARRCLDGTLSAISQYVAPGVPISVATCPECGPDMQWDEAGCCPDCGIDLFYDDDNAPRPENFAVLLSMPTAIDAPGDALTSALARFAAEVKASVTANTHEAGYVSLAHLFSLIDPAIAKGTP